MGKQFSTSTSHKRWPCTTSLIFLLDRQTDSYAVFGGNNVRLGFCQISKDFYKDFPRAELSCSNIFQSENYFQLRLDTSFLNPSMALGLVNRTKNILLKKILYRIQNTGQSISINLVTKLLVFCSTLSALFIEKKLHHGYLHRCYYQRSWTISMVNHIYSGFSQIPNIGNNANIGIRGFTT